MCRGQQRLTSAERGVSAATAQAEAAAACRVLGFDRRMYDTTGELLVEVLYNGRRFTGFLFPEVKGALAPALQRSVERERSTIDTTATPGAASDRASLAARRRWVGYCEGRRSGRISREPVRG